ncbi:MAG: ABC transporter substrate-binding protein [Lachnospiraceae bacterium]|jgi:branched-chain amino acid transport system substrate-binding protein|nr:ABC transporter substrate-binding protein [Lachnospiraceae bacterium]
MKRIVALLLTCSLLLTALAGCGDSEKKETAAAGGTAASAENNAETNGEAETPTYGKTKLAAPIPLTGPNSQYGIAYRNALEMAVKEFNENGGLNGTEVVLEVLDDQSDVTQATNLANQLIDDPDVFAVVGTFGSSVGMAVAPTYQEGGMPLIAPNISHQDFPTLGDLLVPISPTAVIEINGVADVLYKCTGEGTKMAILYATTDLGVNVNNILSEKWPELGGELVYSNSFVSGETKDFSALLTEVIALDPDIIYVSGEYYDVASVILQARQLGVSEDVIFSGPGQCFTQEFIDLCGAEARNGVFCGTLPAYFEDVITTEHYSDTMVNFMNDYNETYPETCNGFAGNCYDGIMLTLLAAKKVGTDDAHKLVEAILSYEDYESVSTSHLYFTDYNYANKELCAYTVKDGKFAVVEY